MTRLLITLLALFACALAAHAQANPERITLLGDNNFKPYSYLENGRPEGIYVNVLRALDKRMSDYTFEIQLVDWADGVNRIKIGEAPALMGVWFRPETRPFVAPYSIAVNQERTAVYCRDGFASARTLVQFPRDFKGTRLANNTGFDVGGEALKRMIATGDITLIEAKTAKENLRKLLNNEADCYANDKLAIRLSLKALSRERVFIGAPELRQVLTIQRENTHLGYSKSYLAQHPELQRFIDRFDEELGIMLRDGDVEAIFNLYLSTH